MHLCGLKGNKTYLVSPTIPPVTEVEPKELYAGACDNNTAMDLWKAKMGEDEAEKYKFTEVPVNGETRDAGYLSRDLTYLCLFWNSLIMNMLTEICLLFTLKMCSSSSWLCSRYMQNYDNICT